MTKRKSQPKKARRDFDAILEKAIAALPQEFAELLRELPVIVEDEPSAALLRDLNLTCPRGESDLCGLYCGTPLTERSVFAPDLLPPQILIFRGPIRRLAGGDERELARQIRITLLHEIGHHAGLDDERLHELGYE